MINTLLIAPILRLCSDYVLRFALWKKWWCHCIYSDHKLSSYLFFALGIVKANFDFPTKYGAQIATNNSKCNSNIFWMYSGHANARKSDLPCATSKWCDSSANWTWGLMYFYIFSNEIQHTQWFVSFIEVMTMTTNQYIHWNHFHFLNFLY